MNDTSGKSNQDSRAFFKLIGVVIGALGGLATLFVAFGYITLQIYLSHMKLYGLASFPLQFFKEATITCLWDTLDFYTRNVYFIAFPIVIISLPLIFRNFIKSHKLKEVCGILVLIVVSAVTFFTFALGILKRENVQEILFFAVSLPVLLSLFLYLMLNFESLDYKRPLRNYYGIFLILFLLLFLVIPIGYGSHFFDIPVFTASVPDCSSQLSAFEETAQKYKLLYLMGHTSDREIFFDATTPPITIIVVDKKLIKSIKVNYSQSMTNSLRDLFNMERRNFFSENKEFQKEIMGEQEKIGPLLDPKEVNLWLEQEDKASEKKKGGEK